MPSGRHLLPLSDSFASSNATRWNLSCRSANTGIRRVSAGDPSPSSQSKLMRSMESPPCGGVMISNSQAALLSSALTS